jgi:threonine synthase
MSDILGKYDLQCRKCGSITLSMGIWFKNGQQCHSCGNKWVDVRYSTPLERLKELISSHYNPKNVFHYAEFLPVMDSGIFISRNEGTIPVESWSFLSDFAREKFGLEITVQVYRNDLNGGTGTFKDVAAAVAATVLKENGIKQYAVASTGNIASAFAFYLAQAGISLTVFMPQDALPANEAEVNAYGQKVYRVKGDYAMAKKIAAEYSSAHGILLSGGNTDPMRVEAKKTMVWEWVRQTGRLPDVYIQALSGGTGPIAIEKGCNEIRPLGLIDQTPRYIMVQPDGCDPMTVAWNKAKSEGFPNGWEQQYPVFENPVTIIPTLATGNPATYPIIGSLVKKSGGEIITYAEGMAMDLARLIAFETGVKIGPASTIAMGGFFEALKKSLIRNGETVLINIGEGMNRAPEFVDGLNYTTQWIDHSNQCTPHDRLDYRKFLWEKFN